MTNLARRPRPSKSTAAVEVADATEAPVEVAATDKVAVHISSKLALPMPAARGSRGRPSVFNLDAMAPGECFLFNPDAFQVVRRAAAAANQKWSKPTGETKLFRGQEISAKEKTRQYKVVMVSGPDMASIPDDVLQSVFPDADSRPSEVGGCWRVL